VFDECDGGETFEDRLVVGVRRNGGEIDALALRVGPDVTDKLTGPSVKKAAESACQPSKKATRSLVA
jgi:hypothetical protein